MITKEEILQKKFDLTMWYPKYKEDILWCMEEYLQQSIIHNSEIEADDAAYNAQVGKTETS